MPLPSSGPFSLKGIRDEFEPSYNGVISLTRYTVGGDAGVTSHSGANIPAKGQRVDMTKFRNTFKLRAPAFSGSIPAQAGNSSAANVVFDLGANYATTTYSSTVTYSLGAGAPAGVSIDPTTGAITVASGTTVNETVTVIATGPTGLSSSTTVQLNVTATVSDYTVIATIQLSFYEVMTTGDSNVNLDVYDYNYLITKYPIGTYFYIKYQSNYFRLRFNSPYNFQIRNTTIQKLSANNATWVWPSAGDLPYSTTQILPTTVLEVPNPVTTPILQFDASMLSSTQTVGAPVTSWTNKGSWGAAVTATGYNSPTLGVTPGASNNTYFINFNRAQSQYFNIGSSLPMTWFQNGSTYQGTQTAGIAMINRTTTVNYIGRPVVGSDAYLNADIAEIRVFNTTLSNTDRGTVFTSLQNKYQTSSAPIPSAFINLDARSLTTSNKTGGTVGSWVSSGTTNINGTGYNSTTLSNVNGLPCVTFDRASSSYYNLGSLAMNWFANGGVYKGATIFVVGQYQGAAGFYERWIDFNNGLNVDMLAVFRVGTTNAVGASVYNGSTQAANNQSAPTFTEDNGIHVFVVVVNNTSTGSSITCYRDSTTSGTTVTSATVIQNRTVPNTYVGRSPSGSDAYLNGNIYQILVFDSALGSTDLANVYSKLRSKWSAATTAFPPGPMTSNSTALSDGTYVASSPSNISTDAYVVFDQNMSNFIPWNMTTGQAQYNSTTGDYTGTGQYCTHWYFNRGRTQSNNGDFVQLKMPNTILLSSYTVTASNAYPARCPKSFVLVGSIDGAIWYWIDEQTNLTWTGGELKTFYTPHCDTAYSHFKLVDYAHNAGDNINSLISDVRFYGAYSTQNLPTVSVSQWPSGPFASATTTDSVNYTASLAEGQYTVRVPSSPSVVANFEPWRIFDATPGTTGGMNYATTRFDANGVYTGANTTTYTKNGTSLTKSGDWVQLQVPTAIQVCYFALTAFFDYPNRAPKSFLLLGSNDGTAWTWIDEETALIWSSRETKVFAVSTPTSATYRYFRIVDYEHNTGDNAMTLIGNLVFYGNTTATTPSKVNPFVAPIAAYDSNYALWSSTTVPDLSGNQRSITMNATPTTGTWPPCMLYNSKTLNGSATFSANWYAWTVEMVVYVPSSGTGHLVQLPNRWIQWNGTSLYMWDGANTSFNIPASSLSANTWYHVVLMSDGCYFLNNVKAYGGRVPTAITNGSSYIRIGDGSGSGDSLIGGGIGLLRVYDKIISDAQVAANYAIVQPIYLATPTVPVAAYDNNRTLWTGTTTDLTGNARTMTFAGGTPRTIMSPPHLQLENTVYAATSSLSVNWSSWSVEVVAYMAETSLSPYNLWNLIRLPSTITFQWDNNANQFKSAVGGGTAWPVTLQPFTWYHLVFRSDGTIYVNSTSKTTGGPVNATGALSGPLYIGFGDNASAVYTMEGGLGVYRVYDRLLTDAQVQTHYNALQPIYWGSRLPVVSFDNNTALWSGTTVADLSGNGRSLTMSGTRVTASSPPYLALANNTMGTTATLNPMGSIWSGEFVLFISETTSGAFVARLYGFNVQWNANNKQLYIWNGSASSFNITMQLNTWYHLVLLSNGTYYLNNVKTTGGTSPGGLKYTNNTIMLGYTDGGSNKTTLGGMGVFRVYNSHLTDAQVSTNYNIVQPIYLASPAVPVVYYDTTSLGSAWGSTATDLVPGSTRTMTFNGGAVTPVTSGTKRYVALASSQYAIVSSAFGTDFVNGWSIEFLINITGYTSGAPFVCLAGTAGSGNGGQVQYDGSKLYYWDNVGRYFDLTVRRNTWYHVIMQSNGTCIVNGTKYTFTAPTTNPPAANVSITPMIGGNSTAGQTTVTSQMAMMRLYNQAISNATASTNFNLYATSFSIPYMPVLYYDAAISAWGTTAPDLSPYGVALNFNSATTTTTSGSIVYATMATSRLAIAASAITVDFAAGWTIEFLVNITGYPITFPTICQPRVLTASNGTGTYGQVRYNGTTNRIYLYNENVGSGGFFYIQVSQNTWYHVIMQSDGTYYLNGVQGTASAPANNNTSIASIIPTIGRSSNTFTGQMAMYRLYNRKIDNTTALSNYNNYKTAYGI